MPGQTALQSCLRAALEVSIGAVTTLVMSGCAFFDANTFTTLATANAAPDVQMRLAAAPYLTFSHPDPSDNFRDTFTGYMCVEHYAGCGVVGNDGIDRFFAPPNDLPLLAKLSGVFFTPYWPNDKGSSTFEGVGVGSFGMELAGGTSVSPEVDVRWNNTCKSDSPFDNKTIRYSISFVVTTKGLSNPTELVGDATAVPYSAASTSPCAWPNYKPGDTQTMMSAPSMTAPTMTGTTPALGAAVGIVYACNPTTENATGTLHIEAKNTATPTTNPVPTSAPWVMNVDIPNLVFTPAGSSGSQAMFSTQPIFALGTWNFSTVKITGISGSLSPATGSFNLPGTPVFDFREHGTCPLL